MSTSRIYITGQSSVEIDNEEISTIQNQQWLSARLYVRCIFMLSNVFYLVIAKLFKYSALIAFGTFLFLIFFSDTEAISVIGAVLKAQPVEILDMLRGYLSACIFTSGLSVLIVSFFYPKQFGFKNVFNEDLFIHLAKRLKIKPHQIECIVDSEL